jgi:hypothetical protein
MRQLSLLLLLLFTPTLARQVHQNAPAPYLYYYSDVLNGFVIERADGTDSRLIGAGLTPSVARIRTGGWSPDGKWLAWKFDAAGELFSYSDGVVLNTDQQRLKSVDNLASVFLFNWSPDSRVLLIAGCSQKNCQYSGTQEHVYDLIDVNADKVLASIVTQPELLPGTTPVQWSSTSQQVTFYEHEYISQEQNLRITMGVDGSVLKQPISHDEYFNLLKPFEDTPLKTVYLTSPSGHFGGQAYDPFLTDMRSGKAVWLPHHSDAVDIPNPMQAKWHPSEEWVLLGYNYAATESWLVGFSMVYNVKTGQYRQLTSCGLEEPCIGWLPEDVKIADLPAGAPASMLPAPIHYDESVSYSHGLDHPRPRTYSPDGKIYTDLVISPTERRTALFDAQTGNQLIVLNVYGFENWFSPDGRYLYTRGRNAILTWDVDALLGKRNP